MGRRQAREKALQTMFQIDVGKSDPEMALRSFAGDVAELVADISVEDSAFTRNLVFGALQNLGNLDQIISNLSRDWDLGRMPNVDRNIMRLALYEILHLPEIPPGASINEAVEMAKKFGGEDSGRFINGILGKVAENLDAYRI
ncbi:MAG: transcription antitermination factor NusB [Bacillota bacterium]|jgi:N utilization substance protein B